LFLRITWEQRKLGELVVKGGSGGTPTTSNAEYYMGNIPFLSITDISSSNGYIYDTEKHITEEALNSSAAWIVPSESIALAMYASVGKVAILKQNIATSQAFYNMVIPEITTRDYIYQYLKKLEEFSEWDPLISTGTQANLNAEKVKNLLVNIPKEILEQKEIGATLNFFDHLITLHQRKHFYHQRKQNEC
jgi:type I restriction enzyme S subunit